MNNLNKIFKILLRYIVLFLVYGTIYFLIECIFKQKITDIRMFILGAILAILIGLTNNVFTYDTNFILQCLIGAVVVTLIEAITGYQWNTIEQRAIWNYSHLPFSYIDGNINLFFSIFAWIPLSGVCILLDDMLRYYVFKQDVERPHYIISKNIHFNFPERKCYC